MAAHFNLSCDDLKFRWKIEPIKKEEEKLKVLIKGEEAALQKLLAQKEAVACKNEASNLPEGATDNDKTSLKTEDGHQETVLKLRCDRKRKKLAEMHSKKLEIMWDFVKEWLKLEVDRLSAENFIKKNPSVKKLANFYIKYPLEILDEEEAWKDAEKVMARTTFKPEKECEIKCDDKTNPSTEVTNGLKIYSGEESKPTTEICCQSSIKSDIFNNPYEGDTSHTNIKVGDTEPLPIQESAAAFQYDGQEIESSQARLPLGENYLNQVANTNCPWQLGCNAYADWEFAKKLQLETNSYETDSTQNSKAFLEENHEKGCTNTTKRKTNSVKPETSRTTVSDKAQSQIGSCSFCEGAQGTFTAGSPPCSKPRSRRGRGGYVKQQQQKSANLTLKCAQVTLEGVNPFSHDAQWTNSDASVKTYAKVLIESKPTPVRTRRKSDNESLYTANTNSKNKSHEPGKGSITRNSVTSQTHTQNVQGLANDEKSTNSSMSVGGDENIPAEVKLKSTAKFPVKTNKQNACKSCNRSCSDKRKKIGDKIENIANYSASTTGINLSEEKPAQVSTRVEHENRCIKSTTFLAKKDNTSSQPTESSMDENSSIQPLDSTHLATDDSSKTLPCERANAISHDTIKFSQSIVSTPPGLHGHFVTSKNDADGSREHGPQAVTTDCETTTQASSRSNEQEVNISDALPEKDFPDSDNLNVIVPPLDLSKLSDNSDDATPPRSRMISFVGDTYDSSVVIGNSFEQSMEDERITHDDVNPSQESNSAERYSGVLRPSVFNFFFQGLPAGGKLPDGFPRFQTPRKEDCTSKISPSQCQLKAGDFRPFQNSWLGGLPGAISAFSPGGSLGYPHIWNNHYQPNANFEQWSPNEAASNHLKRMLRITSDSEEGNTSAVSNSGKRAMDLDMHARSQSQIPVNIPVQQSQDRGDRYFTPIKQPDNMSDDASHSAREMTCTSENSSRPAALHARLSYHDEVPQRLRRSDSDEDFGSYFPSSSVFDNLGI